MITSDHKFVKLNINYLTAISRRYDYAYNCSMNLVNSISKLQKRKTNWASATIIVLIVLLTFLRLLIFVFFLPSIFLILQCYYKVSNSFQWWRHVLLCHFKLPSDRMEIQIDIASGDVTIFKWIFGRSKLVLY